MSQLSGIAHSIANHSSSLLSHVAPQLSRSIREDGHTAAQIDLFALEPLPPEHAELIPFHASLTLLNKLAKDMIVREGMVQRDLSSVILHLMPAEWDAHGNVLHTRVVITDDAGMSHDSGWLE